ncbi:uncharacterized protein LOC106082334 [Stomoxys calcitrans]|uniref:RHD domain-containing protein n=1 Tax=Stomoxys calcitrans TaxID=35570 RepID=A0A1I8Q553_STOCA|nr:uncharacterized protein LOC106082334 [Stomoxys calcitrans]XP_059225064.1 uncharacterized protein LOC106082334 [Stomoxys calcitrans]
MAIAMPLNDGYPRLQIQDEPKPLHKFIYKSQNKHQSSLQCKILIRGCHQSVFIRCDVYSQTKPPELSHQCLVPRNFKPMNFEVFPIISMSPTNGVVAYNLENYHIFNVSKKKRNTFLLSKLRREKMWICQIDSLTEEDNRYLRSKVDYDYNEHDSDRKVYLGFTAYIRNPDTNTMELYADTIFSQPIYDISNSKLLDPCIGNDTGGSEHLLRFNIGNPNVRKLWIKLYDENGWEDYAYDIRTDEKGFHFKIPPFSGKWHEFDESHMVHLQLICLENDSKKMPIKFLYKRSLGLQPWQHDFETLLELCRM